MGKEILALMGCTFEVDCRNYSGRLVESGSQPPNIIWTREVVIGLTFFFISGGTVFRDWPMEFRGLISEIGLLAFFPVCLSLQLGEGGLHF